MNKLQHLAIATNKIYLKDVLNTKDVLIKDICIYAKKHNVKTISIYAKFSDLLDESLDEKYTQIFKELNVRFNIYSNTKIDILNNIELNTSTCKELNFILCLDYNAKKSILNTINSLDEITQENINKYIDNSIIPPIDLLIRTGNLKTLSNVPIWQCAYAEFCFSKTSWKNFTCKELDHTIAIFTKTHRRFGGL